MFEKYDPAYTKKFYRQSDEKGQFQIDNLTGAGSGKPWSGVNPDDKGRHWAVPLVLLERHGLGGQHRPDRDPALPDTPSRLH
jgi:hypothetical protein